MSEETQEEVQSAPEVADINVNDLAVVLQVIDVCSKRGAFEGNELKDVGTLRERIAAFLNKHAPKPEPEEGESEDDAATDAAAEEAAAAESDS